jgi:glycosyltransferase involved in cell wall biosynthesis
MRILFTCPSFGYGGAERYSVAIATAAAGRGHAVSFAAPACAGTEPLFAALAHDAITPYRLTLRAPPRSRPEALWSTWVELRGAIGLIRSVAPDAMHVSLPFPTRAPGLQLAAALCRVPTVVVFQVVPEELAVSRARRALKSALRARHTWIAVSEANRLSLERAFSDSPPIQVIHNGVAVGRPPSDQERAAARATVAEELDVESGEPLIVTVGRLEEQKGHRDLIAALAGVAGEGRAFNALWAGEGALRADLARELERRELSDRVRLLGDRDDVPRLLAAADLFVLPSRFEGLSFALLEAMAHATPTIASDAAGNDAVIRHGENGMAFAAGDPAQLQQTLLRALDDPAAMRRMADAAHADVSLRFSRAEMIERTLRALEPPR